MSSAKLDRFVGSYVMVESDNFEEFMKAMGVNFALRKLAGLTPSNSIEYSRVDEKTLLFKSFSPVRNSKVQFELGTEVVETLPDGRQVKSTITYDEENDQLFHRGEAIKPGEKSFTLTRSLSEDGQTLTLVFTCEGVKSVRKYRRKD